MPSSFEVIYVLNLNTVSHTLYKEICYVVQIGQPQAGVGLPILLPVPPEHWDYRHVLPMLKNNSSKVIN
jgi:hypothetical protein